MPTWGEILNELQATISAPGMQPDYDAVRRKYLKALAERTGRSTILYATDFLSGVAPASAVTINLMDVQAMMEVLKDLPGPNLDLILHTPGGSPEALESVVRYLRTRFDHIRAFIPLAAMSAGTMWALACDEIYMGKHSQLGPIDPQFALAFGEQIRLAPAQAILDQFEYAKEQCKDADNLPAWITVLRSYGASLLEECRKAQELSETLVSQWLETYMFRDLLSRSAHAKEVAKKFADYQLHYSHGRPISRDQARDYGVNVKDLEEDQDLQDAVLSVFHATAHTLGGTPCVKLVENNIPRTFALLGGVVQIQVPAQQPPSPQPGGPPQQAP